MKEIKFRGCHTAQDGSKLIFYPNDKRFRITMDGDVLENYGKSGEEFWEVVYDADVELQQYTGLKDKNGKEIYDGDILEYQKECEEGCCRRPTRGQVFIEISQAEFYTTSQGEWLLKDEVAENSIVIGNIFENPDLLKETF